jgi:DhnA family fructose-bisphosphate aldolase class Ia
MKNLSDYFDDIENDEDEEDELTEDIENWIDTALSVKNDTVFSRWGMLTQDKRYNDDTENLVKQLSLKHNLSNDQAHYFLYMMVENNLTYEEAKEQLLSNKEFEDYDKLKKARRGEL